MALIDLIWLGKLGSFLTKQKKYIANRLSLFRVWEKEICCNFSPYVEGERCPSVWKPLPPSSIGFCSHLWLRRLELLKSVKLQWCQSLENWVFWVNRFRGKEKKKRWLLTISRYSCGESLLFIFTPFKKETVFSGVLLQQHLAAYCKI